MVFQVKQVLQVIAQQVELQVLQVQMEPQVTQVPQVLHQLQEQVELQVQLELQD
jgi:hypothetical protein